MEKNQTTQGKPNIKIIAFSDSHGDTESFGRLISHINSADYCFFLGDGLSAICKQIDMICVKFHYVSGNCDNIFSNNVEQTVKIGNCNFLLTHGHKYGVKQSLLNLRLAAQSKGCNYAVFGHTHIPKIESVSGVTLINPGSLLNRYGNRGTYALIEGDGDSFSCEIKTIY